MSSSDSPLTLVEHNLLIARVGLELGILTERIVKNAFTLWVCERTETLENLLFMMKAIDLDQKAKLSEAVKEWRSKRSLSEHPSGSPSDLKALENILGFLEDSDINQSISSIQTQEMSSGASSTPVRVEFQSADPSAGSPAADRFVRKHLLTSQGGMGEIWIAADRELNREVIVKYIKEDRAKDSQHRGMFHLEGEVTGFLEHPNIPPVYGLGNDSEKRPYYAMRYYQGKKFTKAIAEYHALKATDPGSHREAFRDLLQSFVSACLAVEYAHSRGVIHCDIKPDNIILGDFGETIVLDWGLVVVTQPTGNPEIDSISDGGGSNRLAFSPSKFAEEGLHLKQGGSRNYVGGTLAYMAPEQLVATETGEIEKVTKASDIYCLGSTLYHLCTGRAPLVPFRKKDERKDSYFYRIKNARFPRPRSLRPDLSPRLEAIIYKAMALNPTDRYASAQILAEDVKHWLADEPVAAYPEGAALKLGRWVRRNRERVALGFGIFLICLIAGTSLVWWERQKTYANFKKAQKIGQALVSLMKDSEAVYASMEGMTAKRKEVFLATTDAFKSFVQDLPDDAELLQTYADVSRFLANVERFDNQLGRAVEHYDESIRTLNKLQHLVPQRKIEFEIDICGSLREIAGCLNVLGQQQKSKAKLEEALTMADKMIADHPGSNFCKRQKALGLLRYSGLLQDLESYEESEKAASESVKLFAELVEKFEGTSPMAFDLLFSGTSISQLAVAQRFQKKLADAEKNHEEALNRMRPMTNNLKLSPLLTYMSTTRQDIVSQVTECLGERLRTWIDLKKPDPMIDGQFQMLLGQWKSLVETNPQVPSYREGLANMLLRFGEWKIVQKPVEARPLLEQARLELHNLMQEYPDVPYYKNEWKLTGDLLATIK